MIPKRKDDCSTLSSVGWFHSSKEQGYIILSNWMVSQNLLSRELFWLGGKDDDEARLFWHDPIHTYMRHEKHCFTLHLRKSSPIKSPALTSKFFHEFSPRSFKRVAFAFGAGAGAKLGFFCLFIPLFCVFCCHLSFLFGRFICTKMVP